jgi:hypothetical protein
MGLLSPQRSLKNSSLWAFKDGCPVQRSMKKIFSLWAFGTWANSFVSPSRTSIFKGFTLHQLFNFLV